MHANRSALWNAAAWLEILGLTHDGHRLLDVPALPRHGPQRGGDGDDVGRRQGPPRRRLQRHPLLGRGQAARTPPGSATWASSSTSCTRSRRRPDDADNAVRIAFGAAAPPGDHDALRGALRPAAGRGLRLHRARPGERAQVPAAAQAGHDGPAVPAPARRGPRRGRQPAAALRARRDRRPPRRAVRDRPGLLERAPRHDRRLPQPVVSLRRRRLPRRRGLRRLHRPRQGQPADDAARTSRASRSSAASSATPTCSNARPTPSPPS